MYVINAKDSIVNVIAGIFVVSSVLLSPTVNRGIYSKNRCFRA